MEYLDAPWPAKKKKKTKWILPAECLIIIDLMVGLSRKERERKSAKIIDGIISEQASK